MVIKELQLIHFGKFHQKTILLQPGMNIIYGENEAGKSTIHRFIRAMLFGVARLRGKGAANDDYSRFQPWDDARGYEGLLIFEHGGQSYRIYRNFRKEEEIFKVFDNAAGQDITPKSGSIEEIIPALTEANYRNTISIAQQESRLDDKFAESLQNYMINMSMSRDAHVDISRALTILTGEEKKIRALMPVESMAEIKKSIDLEQPSEETVRKQQEAITSYEQQEAEAQNQIAEYKEKIRNTRAREQQERMEGMQLLEQQKGLLRSLKQEEDRAQNRKDVGLMGQWSFRIFIFMTVLAIGWMLVQWILKMDVFAFKISAGLLLIGALIALAKTSFKKTADVIDVESYEHELTVLQENLAWYVDRYGPQMMAPGQAERMQKHLDRLTAQREGISQKKERAIWEIERLEEQRLKADALKESYEQEAEQNRKLKKELEALAVAKMVISDLTGEIHQQFGTKLNEQAASIFTKITGRESRPMMIDEKLNVSIDGIKQQISLNRLSTASIDQIYFALRFCAGALIFGAEQMPMVLDDCFAFYDDGRLRHILEWMAAENKGQTIILTCHHREAETFDKIGCEYHSIIL